MVYKLFSRPFRVAYIWVLALTPSSLVMAVIVFLVMKLGGFHIYLYFKGLSTYDYIMQTKFRNKVTPKIQKDEAKAKKPIENEENQKVTIKSKNSKTKFLKGDNQNNHNRNDRNDIEMENSSKEDADTFSFSIGKNNVERRNFLPKLDLGSLRVKKQPHISEEREDLGYLS